MSESPLYYQTCFYRNLETRDPTDQTKYIVLASIDQVIDKSMENGSIDRHELLQVFSDVLNPWDIDSNSGIVEYVFRLDNFQLRENRVFTIRQ
jgi:hypothetical protein